LSYPFSQSFPLEDDFSLRLVSSRLVSSRLTSRMHMHVQCTMRRAAEYVNLTIMVAVVLVVVAVGTSSGSGGVSTRNAPG